MFYSVIYRCNRRTFAIDVNFKDAKLSDDYKNHFLLYQIEKFKADRGLTEKKHIIQEVKLSIDGKVWFSINRKVKGLIF